MMNKKNLNEFMKKVDKTKTPKHWDEFIIKNVESHNLIIKHGKKAFCTYCQKYFDKNVTVHPYNKDTCDLCGKEYYVANHNIRNYKFYKDIAFYSKVDGKVILRVFEVESKYNYTIKAFQQHLQEYARFIPDIGTVINNTVSFYLWNIKVYHSPIIDWHIYTGNKLLYQMPIYPYNKRTIFKGTPLEYAPIQEFKKEYNYYNDFQILQIASYQSFELLWKMGLYRLSLSSKHFNKKGSFNKRFGVPKSFLKFMVENNIGYDDYKIMKLLQEPNMDLIYKYRAFNYNYLAFMKKQGYLKNIEILNRFKYDEDTLRIICKYVPLKKFLQYEKGLKNIHLYADYLHMAEQLNYSIKSKKRMFPKQLKARHGELSRKIVIIDDMNTQFAVYLRYLELSKYTYQDDKYIIFPAPSVDDIKEEGKQQGNCVATTYLTPYLQKETEIYFIRKLDNPDKSFITLEYKYGKIRQKELPHHSRKFTAEHEKFCNDWIIYRNFIDGKANKQSKVTNIVEYKLEKLVA